MSPTSNPQDAGEIPLSAATPRQLLEAFIAHAQKPEGIPEIRRREGRHWKQVLDQQKAEQIRARYAAGGVTQAQLGEEYGVRTATISRVITGKLWPSVTEGSEGQPVAEQIVGLLERIARNLELPRRSPAPPSPRAASPRPTLKPAIAATDEAKQEREAQQGRHRRIPKSLADAMVERGYWTAEYAEARVKGGPVPPGIRQSPAK